MTPARRLAYGVAAFAGLIALGTLGYATLTEMSWLDALYMTVTTITTVGFREMAPFGPSEKIFTIGLILVAVGFGFYLFTTLAQFLIEGRLQDLLQRRAMQRKIDSQEGHVIVCGYGRLGRIVAEELRRNGAALVIVESDATKEPELLGCGLPYVIGSALSEEVLARVGLERARAIVVGTGSDADNVFITLSARERNPRIRIHARAESDTAARRLRQAGAEQVVSPYQMGGQRLAGAILRPSVVDFLEIAHPRYGDEVDLEELRVESGSALEEHTILDVERQAPRLRIVALKRGEERVKVMPEETTRVAAGDHLVVVGARESLEKLAQLAAAPGAAR
jgi:voltage-gated potassium channel